MKIDTICTRGTQYRYERDSDRPPIYMNNLYDYHASPKDYSRYWNVNRDYLGTQLCAMYENIKFEYTITSSSMNAIYMLIAETMATGRSKITVIADKYCYFETLDIGKVFGKYVEMITTDFRDIDKLESLVNRGTTFLFMDSLSLPHFYQYDIASIAKIAHRVGAKLCVDNTACTAINCNPLKLGADYVVETFSKYLGGSGDLYGGFLLGKNLQETINRFGIMIPPLYVWQLQRGLTTLPIRMERYKNTAMKVYDFLKSVSDEVYYPGFGSMIIFSLGDAKLNTKVLDNLKLIFSGYSYGYDDTLMSMINTGREEPLLRISVGLEDADDIIEDLRQAIKG